MLNVPVTPMAELPGLVVGLGFGLGFGCGGGGMNMIALAKLDGSDFRFALSMATKLK